VRKRSTPTWDNNSSARWLQPPTAACSGSGAGQRIPSPRFSSAYACRRGMDVWFVLSLASHSERLFVRVYSRRCCGRREKSSNNGMVTLEHPTIKVGTPCWQLLLARHRRLLLKPSADIPTVAFWLHRLLQASQGGLRTRGRRLQLYASAWRRARSWSATTSVRASQGSVGVGSLCPIQGHE
jgi:hypothetical protein